MKISPSVISLDKAKDSGVYRLEKIDDHLDLKIQLAARGFVKGAEIKVVRSSGRGPLLLEIKHGRMALGRNQARRVFVAPLKQESS